MAGEYLLEIAISQSIVLFARGKFDGVALFVIGEGAGKLLNQYVYTRVV